MDSMNDRLTVCGIECFNPDLTIKRRTKTMEWLGNNETYCGPSRLKMLREFIEENNLAWKVSDIEYPNNLGCGIVKLTPDIEVYNEHTKAYIRGQLTILRLIGI